MITHRDKELPLEFQINSKVSESDYLVLREISAVKQVSQAALIRSVLRQYIKRSKLVNPLAAKKAC